VVAGLRDKDDLTVEHYPWENYWMDRLGIPDFQDIITFDPGLNVTSKDEDILSPSWFDTMAVKLLNEVKIKREVITIEDHSNWLNADLNRREKINSLEIN
jgi:hypothetical protein